MTMKDKNWQDIPPLSWNPETGGKNCWITFHDHKIYDLGPDPDGDRFKEISSRMRNGQYYPKDAVRFSGKFMEENRMLQPGDRIIQMAPIFGKLGGPIMIAVVEIYVSELEANCCKVGYVTTARHFARGMWSAELTRKDSELSIEVKATVIPNSFLYWFGLPYARFLQLRAWRRAIEVFRTVGNPA